MIGDGPPGPETRLMVFGAHAADWCFRAGGTATRYLQAGAQVRVVCATFGERGESAPQWQNPEATVESVKAIRRAESQRAADILGVDIEFLDLDDNPLVIDAQRMQLYVDRIRDFRPDIILTHWNYEPTNRDHQTVSETVVRATSLARVAAVQARDGGIGRARIFLFEPDVMAQPILGFAPDTYIDITPVWDLKMEALESYRPTQPGLLERWPERGQLRGVEARAIGGMPGCQYAEAFRRFQPYAGEYFV